VIACLNAADTAETDGGSHPCANQNGTVGQKNLINGVLKAVCPRATLTALVGSTATPGVAVPSSMQGSAMAVDVENLTGNPASANELHCGTLPCTLFGGSGNDKLVGGALSAAIFGLGGSDNVTINGGTGMVDLTHASGGPYTDTVNCNGNAVTILTASGDTRSFTSCGNANIP
jgi:Ca2+-binding RTX toxin-like protein